MNNHAGLTLTRPTGTKVTSGEGLSRVPETI